MIDEKTFINFSVAADDERLLEYLPNIEDAENGNFLVTVAFDGTIDFGYQMSDQCEIVGLQFSFDDNFENPNIPNFEDLDLEVFESELSDAAEDYVSKFILDELNDFLLTL